MPSSLTGIHPNSGRRIAIILKIKESIPGDKVDSSGTISQFAYPLEGKIISRQRFLGDRFIPLRNSVNTEASNYHLKRKFDKIEEENELKVIDQIKALTSDWRKRVMNQKMQEMNVIPGVRQRQVLKLFEMTTDSCNKFGIRVEGSSDTCWECRPRKKPLIGAPNKGREASSTVYQQFPQIFRFPFLIRGRHLVDWGRKNHIVMAVDKSVGVFDADMPLTLSCERYNNDGFVKIVKWSNDGGMFAIGRTDSTISVRVLEENNDIHWIRQCPCRQKPCCEITGICWSSTDKTIIAACSSGRLTNIVVATGKKENTEDCETEIVYFTLSPNDKFLAVSLQDTTIKIYSWPNFEPYMNIRYYKRVKALAWHPWNSKILCVGGGYCDGSLTVWNINTQTPLQYRRIDFSGAVENVTFNKLTGELVVHWSYWERDRRYAKIVILANLDKIVDVIPIEKRIRIWNLLWNPDHTRMALPSADTLVIWDIFGQEEHKMKKEKKQKLSKFMHAFPSASGLGPSLVNTHLSKGLNYYNIR